MERHLSVQMRILLVLVCCTLFSSFNSATLAEVASINVRCGDRNIPKIAITVDDCYDRKHVLAAVELCEQYDIPITFFPIGNALKFADGPLWQRALDAGCEIGNHSWSHKRLTVLTAHEIEYQMLRTQQKVDEMLGYHYPMQVMRPPYGLTSSKVNHAVEAAGYKLVVRWDVSQTNAQKAIKDVQNGSILLYHARSKDVKCLRELIPQLIEKGYQCVTVSELMGLDPVSISDKIYSYKRADVN